MISDDRLDGAAARATAGAGAAIIVAGAAVAILGPQREVTSA